ncbi:MAG: hypothetical protein ABW036_04655 [Flavitalea sp.]
MKKQGNVSLLFCLLMDLVGYATYTIPFFGEFGDLLWAPISAIVFYKTFGSWKGSVFNFLEEALPFTDFVPSFTLMWVFKGGFRNSGIRTAVSQ